MSTLPLRENPDHEFLAALARDDPESFERLRQELIDQMIGRAPTRMRRRLVGLQFTIDQVRRLAHTPLGATVRLSSLMWSSFLRLNDELAGRAGTQDTVRRSVAGEAADPPQGRVLAFRRPADRIE